MPSRLEPETPKQSADYNHYRSLLAAIRADREEEVVLLLAKERPKGDHRHCTTLFRAAVKGEHPQVIRCLLRHGVVPLGESPLFIAIEKITALEVVLAEGYSVHVTSTTTGKIPLQTAITLNPSALPALLRAGCDVTARDRVQGNTPLHTACAQHQESSILPLLQSGAWINDLNRRGETPLHCLLRYACPSPRRRDFHAQSRQSLARCLIHVGGHVTVTSKRETRSFLRAGKPEYKVVQLYRQLWSETRSVAVWPLQHLCRLTVRRVCEEQALGGRVGEGGEYGDGGEGRRKYGGRMGEVVESLGVSRYLQDYLLYKQHVFDKEALFPSKVKTFTDTMVLAAPSDL